MSLLDEEFDMLGEDKLALLTSMFERLHENRVNTTKRSRTRFQCGKPRHFNTDYLENVENKDSYKHWSRMDNKYRLRRVHKHKHKDEQWSRKKDGRGRKARAMFEASDVTSSSTYSSSSSSSSEDEGHQSKSKKSSKNLSGLSCFARDGFYDMARRSGSKKRHQSHSDSDSEDEVRDQLPFLHEENAHLGNCDDMLRKAKKMRKELRAPLEDDRNRVAELETRNLDAKLEIDSLKASLVVFHEVDYCDCSVYLVDLTALKDKHASTCEELDVLRVEVAELKSRTALLGFLHFLPCFAWND
jgi:hypothetical protein